MNLMSTFLSPHRIEWQIQPARSSNPEVRESWPFDLSLRFRWLKRADARLLTHWPSAGLLIHAVIGAIGTFAMQSSLESPNSFKLLHPFVQSSLRIASGSIRSNTRRNVSSSRYPVARTRNVDNQAFAHPIQFHVLPTFTSSHHR